MGDVQWVKVYTNMFCGNRKIKQIEKLPNGDTILIIWFKLLLLAGMINDNGYIYVTPKMPYTDETLANELDRPVDVVQSALSVFESFDMIEYGDKGFFLSSWCEYQNTDKLAEMREKDRDRKRAKRAEQKALADVSADSPRTVLGCPPLEEERDKDLEKENHSFFLASEKNKMLERMGGELGKGVVMLSEEQKNDLLDQLTVDEFDKYVKIVADCELSGKHYKNKSHYQAILDMVAKDRSVAPRKNAPRKKKPKTSNWDVNELEECLLRYRPVFDKEKNNSETGVN